MGYDTIGVSMSGLCVFDVFHWPRRKARMNVDGYSSCDMMIFECVGPIGTGYW